MTPTDDHARLRQSELREEHNMDNKTPEAKHTPGPWHVESVAEIWSTDDQLVTVVSRNRKEVKANAELIAQAPEMLATISRLTELNNNQAETINKHAGEILKLTEELEQAKKTAKFNEDEFFRMRDEKFLVNKENAKLREALKETKEFLAWEGLGGRPMYTKIELLLNQNKDENG